MPLDANDDDPSKPLSEAEISETAGLDTARVLANLGVPSFGDAPSDIMAEAAGAPSVGFDVMRAKAFLDACMTSNPRVTYGLGKKVPFFQARPSKDFTQVDCSGFVREAIRLSTTPKVAFPDGSVVQHDWVKAHGFTKSTIAAAGQNDDLVRIAFLRPQDSPSNIGHVVLVSRGKTMESHGGVGPNSRAWTGQGWQAKAIVYVLAEEGAFDWQSDMEPMMAPAAAEAAAATFTVHQGRRYRATVVLRGIEQFAANNQVAARLSELGFVDVVVTGSGSRRIAEATWSGPDTTAEVDSRLSDIEELPEVEAAFEPSMGMLMQDNGEINEDHFCAQIVPDVVKPEDKSALSFHRAAVLRGAKWDIGANITVRFLGGSAALQQRVKNVAKEWSKIANLNFDYRAAGPTDIRIAFMPGKGSWSYLGTQCRSIPEPKPTMNYGWLTDASSDAEVRRVVLHEFGHAIGLIHEHQNPQGGIKWNKDAVRRDLSGPPNNWDDAKIENNMFKFYGKDVVISTDVDPKSIMMYPIPRAWTTDGTSAGLNSQLSSNDKSLIRSVYPGRL